MESSKFMKPPWMEYSFGWLSSRWYLEAGDYKEKFERWFAGLSDQCRSIFVSGNPESPWWPGYYQFILVVYAAEDTPEFYRNTMFNLKKRQKEYAQVKLRDAKEAIEGGDKKGAIVILDEISGNCGNIDGLVELRRDCLK